MKIRTVRLVIFRNTSEKVLSPQPVFTKAKAFPTANRKEGKTKSVKVELFTWEKAWSFLPLDEAMKFIKEDNNMVNMNGNQLRAFPCTGFILKVNKENAVKSGAMLPSGS